MAQLTADETTMDTSGAAVAEVFLKVAEQLKIYVNFVSGYEQAALTLRSWEEDPKLKAFLDEQRVLDSSRLPLSALLIQPVQRICRYPLLFSEVLKSTPTDHSDYEILCKLSTGFETLLTWINEEKRNLQNFQRMTEISSVLEGFPADEGPVNIPGRQVIHECNVNVKIDGSQALCKVLLFNDLLLWGTSGTSQAGAAKIVYAGHVLLDHQTSCERIGTELIRLEGRTWGLKRDALKYWIPSTIVHIFTFKDSVDAEYWYQHLVGALSKRRHVWEELNAARMARLMEQKGAMQRRVHDLEMIVSRLCELLTVVCEKTNVELPTDWETLRNPRPPVGDAPAVSFPPSNEAPYIAVAITDNTNPKRDELAFAFGEMLIIAEDYGHFYMGRPLDEYGDPSMNLKIWPASVQVMPNSYSTRRRVQQHQNQQHQQQHHQQPQQQQQHGGAQTNETTPPDSLTNSPTGPPSLEKRSKTVVQILREKGLPRTTGKPSTGSLTRSSADRPSTGVSPSPKVTRRTATAPQSPFPGLLLNTHMGPGYKELSPGVPDHSQEAILAQGWLVKKGGNVRNWKRRWFLLTEWRLYYYEDAKIVGKKPKGIVPLWERFTVERVDLGDGGHDFHLPQLERTWEFKADNAKELQKWCTVLEELALKHRRADVDAGGEKERRVTSVMSAWAGDDAVEENRRLVRRSANLTETSQPGSLDRSESDDQSGATVLAPSEEQGSLVDDATLDTLEEELDDGAMDYL